MMISVNNRDGVGLTALFFVFVSCLSVVLWCSCFLYCISFPSFSFVVYVCAHYDDFAVAASSPWDLA